MKRILPLLLSLLLLAGVCAVPALAAIDLDSPDYVVDDANVLSEKLENKIRDLNQTLEYDCQGAQLVVVTVVYPTAGMDREEFAKEIFDTWNIGSGEYNNGSLLVIYTESDEFWLECGYGIYNSPYVDEIADMVSDSSSFYRTLQKSDYEGAVSSLVSDLSDWYSHYYGSTANNGSPQSFPGSSGGSVYSYESDSDSVLSVILGLIIIILILKIVLSPLKYHRRYGRWGVWPFVYFSPWWSTRPRRTSTTPPWETNSTVIHTHPYRPPSSTFGSSHSSSHSSFGSHSSHSSFGGFSGGHSGGGGFHGGGGHSGGGFGHR